MRCLRSTSAIEERVGIQVDRFGGECTDLEIEHCHPTALQRCPGNCRRGGGKTRYGQSGGERAPPASGLAATIASTDAPCSSLSIVIRRKASSTVPSPAANPNLVLVDTAIVARAPAQLLVSGMGDALATGSKQTRAPASMRPT
jgi:glycerol dehydrogenase